MGKRMGWGMLAVVSVFLLTASSCLVTQNPDGTTSPGPLPQAIKTIAPFIPGPWGAVAAAAATALVGVGSLLAKRSVNAAHAAEGTDVAVNPITKALAERKYLIPILTAIPMIGKAFNLWGLDWTAMGATLAAALAAVGADVYESAKTGSPPSAASPIAASPSAPAPGA